MLYSQAVILSVIALLASAPGASALPGSQHEVRTTERVPRDGRHDFDFFYGKWNVHHRYLRHRLQGSHEWISFDGATTVWPIIGGLGNIDDNVMHTPKGITRGASVRFYDVKTRKWSIYWGDTSGLDTSPDVGSFGPSGVGLFYDHEVYKGTPVINRFTWVRHSSAHCSWSQAFSADGGKTWETNWTMDFTRPS